MEFDTKRQDVIDEWPSLVFNTEAASGAKADNTLPPMLIAGLIGRCCRHGLCLKVF
ncbi:hypothetical protein [Mesorhizobium captivum]|uniref:hypothetical protein n=1 Tax=Mesorhizobium captivum TaxID=3072319 RepID=UPI002A242405|nr:hypothetical protein [Mesorhizobium sp. VK3C]MDX8449479.1 hypothetical protein [Mesorhizobium sp. VK3C]